MLSLPRLEAAFLKMDVVAGMGRPPGVLRGEGREAVAAHLADGGQLGLVLLEIRDFSLLRRLFRPEVADAAAEAMAAVVAGAAGRRGGRYAPLFAESLEPGRMLVVAGGPEVDGDGLDRLAASLRLEPGPACARRACG